MVNCLKCGQTELEWVNDKGQWKLYEADSGNLHTLTCRLSKTEYKSMSSGNIPKDISCSHGILKSRACDICDNTRRGEPLY